MGYGKNEDIDDTLEIKALSIDGGGMLNGLNIMASLIGDKKAEPALDEILSKIQKTSGRSPIEIALDIHTALRFIVMLNNIAKKAGLEGTSWDTDTEGD